MRVRYTALLASTALLATSGAATAQREVTVQAATIQSLDAKLQTFAQGLSPAERAAWNTVLRQAASAPADNPSGVPVRATFYAGCACTTGAPGAIIVQGGRTAASPFIIVQGGAPAGRGVGPGGGCLTMAPRAAGPGGGPTRPGGGGDPAAIGPKPEDPRAIGPKPDDPLVALNAKVRAFAGTLSGSEQAVFDWMLQRAATQGQRGPGGMPAGNSHAMATQGQHGPGGMPTGRTPSLGQALGLLAIGPKQDDPAPPPPSNVNVLLRF